MWPSLKGNLKKNDKSINFCSPERSVFLVQDCKIILGMTMNCAKDTGTKKCEKCERESNVFHEKND